MRVNSLCVLILYGCLFPVRVYSLCVFIPCACLFPVRVYSLCVFIPCACLFPVRVYSLRVFIPCACLFPVRVNSLWVLYELSHDVFSSRCLPRPFRCCRFFLSGKNALCSSRSFAFLHCCMCTCTHVQNCKCTLQKHINIAQLLHS